MKFKIITEFEKTEIKFKINRNTIAREISTNYFFIYISNRIQSRNKRIYNY